MLLKTFGLVAIGSQLDYICPLIFEALLQKKKLTFEVGLMTTFLNALCHFSSFCFSFCIFISGPFCPLSTK
jgi:hypothetical protein